MPPRSIAGAEEDQVVVGALQLVKIARIRSARADLEAEQLLDRHAEDELVAEEGVGVGPRRVGDRLPVRLLLHVLLDARVRSRARLQADHFSPSSVVTSRSTPCVDGMVGPRLISIVSDRRRGISTDGIGESTSAGG